MGGWPHWVGVEGNLVGNIQLCSPDDLSDDDQYFHHKIHHHFLKLEDPWSFYEWGDGTSNDWAEDPTLG